MSCSQTVQSAHGVARRGRVAESSGLGVIRYVPWVASIYPGEVHLSLGGDALAPLEAFEATRQSASNQLVSLEVAPWSTMRASSLRD